MSTGVKMEEDYKEYSNKLKEKDKNYSLYHSVMKTRAIL